MVTAVTLALALGFERPEPEAMRQPPRDPREPLLTRFMLWRIVFVTVFLVAGSLGLFLWELERGMPLEVARTAAINALVMGEIFYLFNCRRLTAPVVGWSGFVGNPVVLITIGVLLVLQGLFTLLNVVRVGQVHLFYRARLQDTRFDPGPETIEAQLFHEHEIPWEQLAFRTVRETLKHYFADKRRGQFGVHCADIA
jgi:magnesium-transporting ATPase (P-type)